MGGVSTNPLQFPNERYGVSTNPLKLSSKKSFTHTQIWMTLLPVKGFTPSLLYLFVTGLYYLTGDPLVQNSLPHILPKLLKEVEGREKLWSIVLLKVNG